MIVIYIIGGLFALILAVYFLDKREKMTHEIKEIKEYRHDIEETNRQLDEVQEQLDMMHEPLSKLNDISKVEYPQNYQSIINTGTITNLEIQEESIDYIFTDPPFGENLMYSGNYSA